MKYIAALTILFGGFFLFSNIHVRRYAYPSGAKRSEVH